ncbi:MAG: GNAT family N-acetyltransferase [Bacteroidaceae bacterium]|nr:GNAT family N-acetyltransferase [Bacteroidaceae bacterium]
MDRAKILSLYGVTLHLLTEDKIELVRRWRTDPKISQYMEYRGDITPEQQLRWFHKIDNENNFFYLIEIDGKEIGLINVRDFDYESMEGEGGIFIWDDEYLNGDASFRAVLCLDTYMYETVGMKRKIGHVLRDNKRAQRFNKFFGFKIFPGQENEYNQRGYITYEDYLKTKKRMHKLLSD